MSPRGGGDTWVCVVTSCPGDSSVPSPPCADSQSTWRGPPDPGSSGPQRISRFVVHKDRNGAAPPPALTVSLACRSVADRRSPQVLVRNLIHHSGLLWSLSTAGTAASGPAGGSSTSRQQRRLVRVAFGVWGFGFLPRGFWTSVRVSTVGRSPPRICPAKTVPCVTRTQARAAGSTGNAT